VLRAASLALALFAVAGPARADGRAKRLTELARQAYARGDAATACALLEQATQDLDEVQKHVGRGACHEMEGRLVEARAAYLAAGARASADAPIAQSIQAQVAGLERRLAAIDVERSAFAPRAATARIDGEPLGPTRTFRAPGPVTVTYEAPGFERETFTITLRPGERRMRKAAADGTFPFADAPVGRLDVTAEAPGYDAATVPVTLVPGVDSGEAVVVLTPVR
jgi:hypothetical protein